ncbi:MBL fold metallo-hydrolase [Microbacterium sp. ZW T5_56]|uniref:MBL fold metallo-hydrolase n=1 Tax=Microbacterium sp. ZW T5_56 TaxID=3378081 RepID=UPI003852A381
MNTVPLLLSPAIALVGGGWLGPELSHPSDANIYLIHDGHGGVLIDAGCGLGSADVLANVRRVGEAIRITAIVVTHAHADHAAGAASLSAATGAVVFATAPVAAVLEGTATERSGLEQAKAAGLYPAEVSFAPLRADVVEDGDTLRVGGTELTLLLTEGHADGHLSVLVREADGTVSACTGDLIFARGRAALLDDSEETDLSRWEASVRRVAAAEPDRLLPGHGTPVLRRAASHLAIALTALDAGVEPPRLIDSDTRPRRDLP